MYEYRIILNRIIDAATVELKTEIWIGGCGPVSMPAEWWRVDDTGDINPFEPEKNVARMVCSDDGLFRREALALMKAQAVGSYFSVFRD